MKKFNKVLALGMAGSMALSMAACGGSSSSASTGTDGSSTSTAAPTAAPSKDVVTLKWVAVGSGIPEPFLHAGLVLCAPFLCTFGCAGSDCRCGGLCRRRITGKHKPAICIES